MNHLEMNRFRSLLLKASAATFLLLVLCCQELLTQEVNVNVRNFYTLNGTLFRWKVYIDEDAKVLKRIRCVEYTLYPSFPKPVNEICDAETHFSLEEEGRGEFTVFLKIEWRDSKPTTQSYALDLHTPRNLQTIRDPSLKGVMPAGLARLKSGGLLIADKGMGHIMSQTSGRFSPIASISPNSPICIADTISDGKEAVLVAVDSGDAPWHGRVQEFAVAMNGDSPIWYDEFHNQITGCAWDDDSETLYVVDEGGWLFGLRLVGGKLGGPGHEIVGIINQNSGPSDHGDFNLLIAWDPVHKSLVVADKTTGKLYRVDPSSHRATPLPLSASIGTQAAIAFSLDGSALYAVDESRIRQIDLDTAPAQVSDFLKDDNRRLFKSLLSLRIDPGGKMLVGDYSGALYTISPEGEVLSVISGR